MNNTPYEEFLAPALDVAREAGELIMHHYAGEFTHRQKGDKSPVTDADIAANVLIVQRLSALHSAIPVIAEEDETLGKGAELFWLVDPLDGTRSFVAREDEFSVNIGLVHKGRPVLGVICLPPQKKIYHGGQGIGAFCDGKPITARKAAGDGLVVVRSRSHPSKATAAYLETLKIKEIIGVSSAGKFCRIAEGSADLYPRLGRTMEWDTAAGHAIVEAAGGRVETVDGKPLTYGKPGFENPHFIAYGKPSSRGASQ